MPLNNKTNTPTVAIIDYGNSNLFSVEHACRKTGALPLITNLPEEILKADGVILPGVGAFNDAMKNLKSLKLIDPLHEVIKMGKPFMGICLGMQLLFTESEEFGFSQGLNVIEGSIKRFPNKIKNSKIRVPHISWNQLNKVENNWVDTPLVDLSNGEFMYFVHSFYVPLNTKATILTETNYSGIRFCSSLIKNNIFACQFHPEKSGEAGLVIYKSWINGINNPN